MHAGSAVKPAGMGTTLIITITCFFCCFHSSLCETTDGLLYKEANLFEGLCWNDVVSEAGKLITRDHRNIGSTVNWNCKTTIKSHSAQRQIQLNFHTFGLLNSTGCLIETVHVYDGDSINSPLLTPEEGLCGDDDPGQFSSSGSSITVQYESFSDEEPPSFSSTDDIVRGFIAYWTSYKPLGRNEDNTTIDQGGELITDDDGDVLFCCVDNSICINSRYRCDGVDNCPDLSDETLRICKLGKSLIHDLALLTGISVEILATIIAVIVFAILLTILLAIICCCCLGTKKKKVVKKILHTKQITTRRVNQDGMRERRMRKKKKKKKKSEGRSGSNGLPSRNLHHTTVPMATTGNFTPQTFRSEDSIYFTDTSLDTFGRGVDRPALLASAAMATHQGMLDPSTTVGEPNRTSYYTGFPGESGLLNESSYVSGSKVVVNRLPQYLDTNPSLPLNRDPLTTSGFHIPRAAHKHRDGDQCSLR